MVDFMETAKPGDICLLPCPVVRCICDCFNRREGFGSKYSVIITIPMVTTKPIIEVKNKFKDEIGPSPCGKMFVVKT